MVILDESPAPKQSRQAAAEGLPVAGPRELHFRLEIVSPEFEGVNKVKRQRMVYKVRGLAPNRERRRVNSWDCPTRAEKKEGLRGRRVVPAEFEGVGKVKRQRMVYKVRGDVAMTQNRESGRYNGWETSDVARG
jgi:stress-induced morphogen